MSTEELAPRRPGTQHPRLARERALKVLFQADVRRVDPRWLLDRVTSEHGALELLDELEPDEEQVAGDDELQVELTRRSRLPLDEYTRTLVEGVAQRRSSIDELLEAVADRWSVQRMPAVDRNVLRLATYELAEQDTPDAVVIDEALALVGAFAGEKAGPFVNGVLETIRRRLADGEAALTVSSPSVEQVDDAQAQVDEPLDAGVRGAGPTGDVQRDRDEEQDDPAAGRAWDVALDLLDDAPGGEDESLDDDLDEPLAAEDEQPELFAVDDPVADPDDEHDDGPIHEARPVGSEDPPLW